MAGFSIDSTKGKIKDIQGNIEKNQEKSSELERDKELTLDAYIKIENSDMADETKEIAKKCLC